MHRKTLRRRSRKPVKETQQEEKPNVLRKVWQEDQEEGSEEEASQEEACQEESHKKEEEEVSWS
jgi:hypothetical protein